MNLDRIWWDDSTEAKLSATRILDPRGSGSPPAILGV